MNGAQTSFPGGDEGGWEENLLELAQSRSEEPASEFSVEVDEHRSAEPKVPLPPPPAWGGEASYADLLDEGMEALLDKRYADAHAAYSQALQRDPRGSDAPMIRGNLARLRELIDKS